MAVYDRTIPLWSYEREYASLREDILAAVDWVFTRGKLILGPEVAAFEERFAHQMGHRHGIGVGNGTDALSLALRALGIGPGDEVITVALTAVATVTAIAQTGARPVFVDVEPDTGLMDPRAIAGAITPRTRCIVPVHLYGQCADLHAILAIARATGLAVVEDCAQSAGATYAGRPAGSFGDLAAFSFYPTKVLGAYGDGGLVATSDDGLAERVRRLRVYGAVPDQGAVALGMNSRLDEVQAAILAVKLTHLDAWIERRRVVAAGYERRLEGSGIQLPSERAVGRHAWHLYVVRHPERDRVALALQARGIGTGVHYPIPVHRMPAFHGLAPAGGLPITEELARTVLSIPMHAWLEEAELDTVAEALAEVARA
jgi:dTDP-3-amino-2,3,6-trideoxy-4-keto-D-glucose/dTDP-3-amino-3,4,6-trideoxy-alpha-D-glucose/dTDP-2,6-dideoxy-D-kanosamine transaminase